MIHAVYKRKDDTMSGKTNRKKKHYSKSHVSASDLKKFKRGIISIAAVAAAAIIAVSDPAGLRDKTDTGKTSERYTEQEKQDAYVDYKDPNEKKKTKKPVKPKKTFDYSKDVKKWDGKTPYTEVNSNTPFFTSDQLKSRKSFGVYGALDKQGRCTTTMACIGKDIMPTRPRGQIGMIKPTGWHTVKYAGIDGNYLYNRCHLIGYQLTGQNANEKNLITGTRYLNNEGMLPFENEVAEYVKSHKKNHVLYRVTPVFKDDDLLARGVLMEAQSIEDGGKGVKFCVFCYNVQPGIKINYSDGSSSGPEFTGSGK